MRRSPRSRSRRRTYLVVLATLSLAAILAPSSWTGKLIGLAQLLMPFQHAVVGAADAVTGSASETNADAAIDPAAHQALQREKEGLEHEVAALAMRVGELQGEVELLTATRLWEVEGRRLGARGRLIPATVITGDLLPWRASRFVSAGSREGLKCGDAVTSRHFSIDRGESDGVRDGMAILLKETLVGVVERVGPYIACVKLLTDVDVKMKVRIGRFTPDGFSALESYFWLTGRGDSTMRIADAQRREVEAGVIQVGDVVLSDPTSEMLPSAMVIGRVTAIEPDHDNPLLSILTIAPAMDESALRRVFVYDSESAAPGGAP